ncbi:MAG: cadherin-like beta sandwich domain-containing protein [Oscillospiraceae bacterium]|jgi:hypothetical protein|nr:cadherin-like beta sandwich domain-containing protein [Oscillospiraceae bacterium]
MRLIISIIFILIFEFYVSALEIKIITPEFVNCGDKIPVKIIAYSDESVILNSLDIILNFNKKIARIIKKYFKNDNFMIKSSENENEIKFNLKNKKKILVNNQETEILNFDLTTKKLKNDILLNFSFENVYFGNNQEIKINNLQKIISTDFEKCFLANILPSIGNLFPKFLPEILEYKIEVPSDTKFIEFKTIGNSGDEKIKINRKKLAKAGNQTRINIEVSKNNSKSIYTLNVFRKSDTKKIYNKKNIKTDVKKSKIQNKNIKLSDKDTIPESELKDGVDDLSEEMITEEIQNIPNNKNNFKNYFGICSGIIISLGIIYEWFLHFKKKKSEEKNEQFID